MSDREDQQEAQLASLYDRLTRLPDVEKAVSGLDDRVLRELNGYIARLNVTSGIPGLIRGVLANEAVERFMQTREAKDK